MRKLDRVLADKGITYEADDCMIGMGPEYDNCQRLLGITDDFIITVFYSAVLDPMFNIFDRRTFEFIAQQDYQPDYYFFGQKSRNPWGVAIES